MFNMVTSYQINGLNLFNQYSFARHYISCCIQDLATAYRTDSFFICTSMAVLCFILSCWLLAVSTFRLIWLKAVFGTAWSGQKLVLANSS